MDVLRHQHCDTDLKTILVFRSHTVITAFHQTTWCEHRHTLYVQLVYFLSVRPCIWQRRGFWVCLLTLRLSVCRNTTSECLLRPAEIILQTKKCCFSFPPFSSVQWEDNHSNLLLSSQQLQLSLFLLHILIIGGEKAVTLITGGCVDVKDFSRIKHTVAHYRSPFCPPPSAHWNLWKGSLCLVDVLSLAKHLVRGGRGWVEVTHDYHPRHWSWPVVHQKVTFPVSACPSVCFSYTSVSTAWLLCLSLVIFLFHAQSS